MNDTHDVRELNFRLRILAKQNGRQGQTIHQLRAELAEARQINGRIARGQLRDLDRQVTNLKMANASQGALIERLREKLHVATAVADSVGVSD